MADEQKVEETKEVDAVEAAKKVLEVERQKKMAEAAEKINAILTEYGLALNVKWNFVLEERQK